LVKGRRPAFLRSVAGYNGSRYRVFVNGAAAASHRPIPATDGGPLAPNLNLSGVCFIAAGGTDELLAAGDFKAIGELASTLHRPLAVAGTVAQLGAALKAQSATGCKRVVLFLIGHGSPERDITADGGVGNLLAGSESPCIEFKGPDNGHGKTGFFGLEDFLDRTGRIFSTDVLCGDQLKAILSQHPEMTFDVQILSCFGGRLVPKLVDAPNVNSIGSASGTKREANGNYGGPSDFVRSVVDGVLRWARDPAAVSQAGGDITAALQEGDRTYSGINVDREPVIYDSVHGEIVRYDKAHPNGEFLPAPYSCPPRSAFIQSGLPGACDPPRGRVAVRVSIAFSSSRTSSGTVDISPAGVTVDSRSPPPAFGNPAFGDLFFYSKAGVQVTLTAKHGANSYFDGWQAHNGGHCDRYVGRPYGPPSGCAFTIVDQGSHRWGVDAIAFFLACPPPGQYLALRPGEEIDCPGVTVAGHR
jgi:hypothetical protein